MKKENGNMNNNKKKWMKRIWSFIIYTPILFFLFPIIFITINIEIWTFIIITNKKRNHNHQCLHLWIKCSSLSPLLLFLTCISKHSTMFPWCCFALLFGQCSISLSLCIFFCFLGSWTHLESSMNYPILKRRNTRKKH